MITREKIFAFIFIFLVIIIILIDTSTNNGEQVKEEISIDNIIKDVCQISLYDINNNLIETRTFDENCQYDEKKCVSIKIPLDNSENYIVTGC